VQQQYVAVNVVTTAPSPTSRVDLGWNSLGALGSGDIKVTISYLSPGPVTSGESGESGTGGVTYGPPTPGSYTSGIFTGDAAASGVSLQWNAPPFGVNPGILAVTHIVVYKKDVDGNWQVVIDQDPGYGPNEITVAAPPAKNTGVMLEMRAAGSSGTTGWWTAGLVNFGNGLRFDARGLALGSYEYRVTVMPTNEASRVTGTGTVAITQRALNSIDAAIHYGQPNVPAGIMTWNDPGPAYTQVFRFRPAGSTGGWTTLPVIVHAAEPFGAPAYVGVDTRGFAAGNYQYELLWTVNGQGAPSSHATGNFVVVAEVPPQWVPPINLPNIGGVAISGTAPSAFLQWNAAGATVARYRVAGGGWNYLTIDNSGVTSGESGESGSGVQRVPLSGIPAGTYQFEIYAGSPPTAQATANVTIYPQNPPWSETVYDQVPVYTPIIASYAPVYETRYAQRTYTYQVRVDDPPYQYISGYTESGESTVPVYSWAYPYHMEDRQGTETYSYQVQVGTTPVYARDEAGNILYSVSYVQQPRTVWHDGAFPQPTWQVTTPPYTPGYYTQDIPAQYGVNVTTTPGSVALTDASGSPISQSAGINGDNRMLRPTVYQKVDRWGNVLEVTDPRSPYWKTTYKYNANNQVVLQTQPDTGTGSPVTAIFYDKMGRQVAVRDANGHVNGQVYDAAGNLVQELHADRDASGGVVTNVYDAFGNKVRVTDAQNKVVNYGFDRMGHMLRMVGSAVGVYTVNGGNALQYVNTRNITQTWTYDQMGNKLSQTNGNGEMTRYAYDLRGNVIATTQPLGQVVRDVYDAQGRKIQETDANGATSTWSYDYFGLLLAHTDLAGKSFSYAYDHARQLTYQSSQHGQSISYTYDAAGQLTVIQDWALGKTTTYAYDLSGRKLRERVVQGGITYQDNHMAYDARGNLRDVADARAHVTMEYDLVGNRTHIATSVDYQGVGGGEVGAGSDRYFQYDAMNRQTVVDGVNAAGAIGQNQGHTITYDHNGNRTSDTYWGPQVAVVGGQPIIWGYNEDGSAIYYNVPIDYVQTSGFTREDYRYDDLNRLQSVVKDGTQIDVRYYDGADRVVQSGPAGALNQKYADIINAGLAPDQMNGKETRINRYDANGRLMHQRVLKSDNSAKVDISWDPTENFQVGTTIVDESAVPVYWNANGYDAAGNALGYIVRSYDGNYTNEYQSTLTAFDGYQAATTTGASTKLRPGANTQTYDANGFLVGLTDDTQGANNRTFVNDASGRALYVNQAGNVQRQMIVNGEVLGLYGAGVNPSNPASGYENNPNFANVVDFDFGYAKVSANYPTPSPGAYTVRTGDTLQTIAQGAYGDSSLWYRIAEANGLGSNADLKVGQTLNIPSRVSTISNNNSTFKPYDPSQIEGDKTPSMATPKPKKKSWLGQLLMVIVAIIVTIYTAGAMSGVAAGFLETMSAGVGVLTGTGAAAAAVAGSALGTAGTLAVAAAAGSVASQLVGLATGTIDKFDWKSVALSAISAGVSAGLPTSMLSDLGKYGSLMVRAAVSNALTQGIGVVLGLQQRFDWHGVAASAAGAAVGQAVGEAVGLPQVGRPASMDTGEFMAKSMVKGLASGLAAAAAKGGKIVVQQVAVDAFGNGLANSLAETQSSMYSLATGDSGLGLRPGAGGEGLTFGGRRAATFTTDDAARTYGALAAAMYASREASQDRPYEPADQYAATRRTDLAGNPVVTDAGGGGGRISDNTEARRSAAQERFRDLEYKSPGAANNEAVPDQSDPNGIDWVTAFGGVPQGQPGQKLTSTDMWDGAKGLLNSAIKSVNGVLRAGAAASANSPEMVIGSGLSPKVSRTRDEIVAASSTIGFDRQKYEGEAGVGSIAEAAGDVAQVVSGGYSLLKTGVALAGTVRFETHIAELEAAGIKFTRENVLLTGRTSSGQVVFLETGNSKAGLTHILERHATDFASAGIPESAIPEVVMRAVTQGEAVGVQRSRTIYQIDFGGQTQRIAVEVGSNGFIVSANPAGRVR